MPQIKVYLNRLAANMIIDETFDDLSRSLIATVEAIFGIEGKEDVAFDVFDVRYTANEAPVQIEVLYTAGEDEYGTGKPFNPGEDEKAAALVEIRHSFVEFLSRNRIDTLVPSIWIRPQYESKFEPGELST
ncbi:MAG: hypothetical protein WC648_01680 [Candidatus Paceibacterota bacterium]|jgi:hypothetical protein